MADEIIKSILTPEQIERNRKLEGIFIPHALRRRDRLFPPGQTGVARLAHYTTAEAALKIIGQKRLWMRNATCMVDYREVQHGFSVLNRYFSQRANVDLFAGAVSKAAPGAAEEAIRIFNDYWKPGLIPLQTFIASASEHDSKEDVHGRLSMWRAIGGNAPRVAIVFNVPGQSGAAMALNVSVSPVAYLTDEETDQLIPSVTKNVEENEPYLKGVERKEIVNWIFHMLLWGVTCIKHEGFREEREWRVVHCPLIFPSPLMKGANETVGGVPQFIYRLPLDKTVDPRIEDLEFSKVFDRLIIAPSPYQVVLFDAYVRALTDAGVAEAGKKISVSNIPIR